MTFSVDIKRPKLSATDVNLKLFYKKLTYFNNVLKSAGKKK